MGKWEDFMKVRSKVLKALEMARDEKIIGKSFEAKVTLYPSTETLELLEKLHADMRQVLIVSDLEIKPEEEAAKDGAENIDGLYIKVEHASGETCERCRIISPEVGSHEDAPTLCNRCYHIVKEYYPEILDSEENE